LFPDALKGKEREVETETEVEVEIEVDGGAPPTKIKRKRRRKKENKAGELPAKLVRMKDLKVCEELPVARSEKDTNQFTTVVGRRVVKADRESEDRKKEALRKKELPKSFIVRVGEKGLGEVKKSLWSEIVGKVGAPKVSKTSVLPRRDLRLIPGDARTEGALRDLMKEGKVEVLEGKPRWPKVVIFDVERELRKEEIPRAILTQNPSLGIEEEESEGLIKPIFQTSPKESRLTNWVCEVSPVVFRRLEGKRLYIGYGLSKVREWVDVTQCNKCQGFGH
jgi:hypothetical protein